MRRRSDRPAHSKVNHLLPVTGAEATEPVSRVDTNSSSCALRVLRRRVNRGIVRPHCGGEHRECLERTDRRCDGFSSSTNLEECA